MPLYGTLDSMPLPDLLQWLGTARKTGTLLVERLKVTKSIVFNAGLIVGCSSDDPPERLGHFLLARGKITEEQLRDALTLQGQSGKYLGMILVEFGAFAPEELEAHLEDKAEETIYSLFDWTHGTFRFQDEVTEDGNIFPVHLRVQDVLLRGLQRFDEMRRIRDVLDDPGIVLRGTGRVTDPQEIADPLARTLFESIDGNRTVAEILLHVHGAEFGVKRELFGFLEQGWVEIASVKQVTTAEASPGLAEQPAGAVAPPSRARPEEPPGSRPDAAPSLAAGPTRQALPLGAPPSILSLPLSSLEPDADAAGGPDPEHDAESDPLLAWEPDLPPLAVPREPTAEAREEAAAETLGGTGTTVQQIRRGLDELVGSETAVEALESSDVHDLARQLAGVNRLMSAGEVEAALERLDRIYHEFPGDESLRRLTAEAEAAFIEKAYRHFLPPSKIPTLTRPMDELEQENVSPTEFFLLSRIDGSWDVRSIIRIAPLRETDALRTLKRLRENGIIELKDPAR